MSRSVLVLGAGMVGVSSALALQKRGFAVTLIDRKPPGSETSFGNAGVISRSSILPLNNPSLWRSLPSYLGNRHLAIRYRMAHLLRNPGWILRFLAETRSYRLGPRVAALDALTAPALGLHRQLMAEAGVGHRLRETGWIKLWRGAEGPAKAAAEQEFFTAHGIRTELLDRQGVSGLEPGLKPIFPAGLFHVDSGSVDWPGAVVEAYARLFVTRGGTVATATVTAIEKDGAGWRLASDGKSLRADLAVVAAGPWSADLLRPLGLTVPFGVERGYHRHFEGAASALTRPIYDVDGAYMLTPMAEGFRLTCGVELADRDAPDDHGQIDAVEPLAREAVALGPRTARQTWRGARPTLPDSLPMIGEAPGRPGLWLAFGNQHIGFSTGPVTGEILAALVAGETPIADPAPFAPSRYL